MILEILNEHLHVEIKSFGAELHSIKDSEGTEYLWQGDAKYWARQAPLLFPVVGNFVDDTTYFNGVAHEILIHGFIRDYEFDIVSKTATRVTLECNWNAETFKRYPYKFCFQTTYSLEGNTLNQSFYIKNLSDTAMPFSLGGHSAFNVPMHEGEKFEDYRIDFLKNNIAHKSKLTDEEKTAVSKEENFNLDHEIFHNGAFIYENLEANALKLYNPKTNKGLHINYRGFPLLGIWTPETNYAPFICIEPWLGMTNKQVKESIEFRKNTLFAHLEPDEYFIKAYSVTVL